MPVHRTCQQCARDFVATKQQVDRGFAKYCSRHCRDDALRTTVECLCLACGGAFQRWPSALLRGAGRYCSRACKDTAATIAIEVRFWASLETGAGCWTWKLATRGAGGYGTTKWQGRSYGTHRVAWELTYGPIPPGMLVCHRCDNPPCCRPDHLFLGTPGDNMRDMRDKGRARTAGRRGEQTGRALLTEEQVRMVRRRRADGETMANLARELRVSFGAIRSIVLGLNWAWLPD
jgi:hypothetical protein